MQNYYQRMRKDWLSRPRTLVGLMTGTSLDGIDAAIVQFDQVASRHTFTLLGTYSEEYPEEFREHILQLIEKKRPIAETAEINVKLANLFHKVINAASEKNAISLPSIDAIGIHGQTVWHSPPDKGKKTSKTGATLQLGNSSTLAQLINTPVVADFRSADVAVGGQGAPLVPIFDNEFLRQDSTSLGVLNIGGIANITLLPSRSSDSPVLAFDTGPGNMLIDAAVRMFFGKKYDENGKIAEAGITIPGLLKNCMEHKFIQTAPPKSTGREMFGKQFLENVLGSIRLPSTPGEDIVRTMTEFTAASIARNVRLFGANTSKIIASGGGIHNPTLMNILKQYLPNVELTTTESACGIPSDYKEAICFAYLAYRSLGGLPGNIPSVTGASRTCILGSISFP